MKKIWILVFGFMAGFFSLNTSMAAYRDANDFNNLIEVLDDSEIIDTSISQNRVIYNPSFTPGRGGDFGGVLDPAGGVVGPVPGINNNPILDGIDQVLNIGIKFWDLIKDSRPVISFKHAPDLLVTANAVPKKAEQWEALEGWADPVQRLFQFKLRHKITRVTIMNFIYAINYTYGGNIEGAGKFLQNVSIQPYQIYAQMPLKVDANALVTNAINIGTKKEPIGALEITVNWKVSSFFQVAQFARTYVIRGDGILKEIKSGKVEKVKVLK